VIRILDEANTELERFERPNEAVAWLEAREGLVRGDLEWVRVHLRYEVAVNVDPPITRFEYRLEHDLTWVTANTTVGTSENTDVNSSS
jgi:hypothetical protein